ncbi:hypothetical protein DFP79_2217 [Marinomonas balearica]|uniref:Uncharacterized protein n=2 Tax=Marinomonas balearica TaxID=491947 RepID=A0A4R6MAY8_9GAMM|nr:hypothetical protein DFP79_2217 [Marinomonas balearica]
MVKDFPQLSCMSLQGSQMITVCGDDNGLTSEQTLFDNVRRGQINTQRIDSLAVLLNGIPVIGEAACFDPEHCFHITEWQFDALLNKLFSLDLSIDADAGLVISCQFEFPDTALDALSLSHVQHVIQATSLESTFERWEQSLTDTGITKWYWLCLDSLCTKDWLNENRSRMYSSQVQTDGLIAGEAIVLSEWKYCPDQHQNGVDIPETASCFFKGLEKWSASTKPEQLARFTVLDSKTSDTPVYIVSNGDLSKDTYSTNYHMRKTWWPNLILSEMGARQDANDLTGNKPISPISGFPFISPYLTLGDCGMANLPLVMILAKSLLHYEQTVSEQRSNDNSNEPAPWPDSLTSDVHSEHNEYSKDEAIVLVRNADHYYVARLTHTPHSSKETKNGV